MVRRCEFVNYNVETMEFSLLRLNFCRISAPVVSNSKGIRKTNILFRQIIPIRCVLHLWLLSVLKLYLQWWSFEHKTNLSRAENLIKSHYKICFFVKFNFKRAENPSKLEIQLFKSSIIFSILCFDAFRQNKFELQIEEEIY